MAATIANGNINEAVEVAGDCRWVTVGATEAVLEGGVATRRRLITREVVEGRSNSHSTHVGLVSTGQTSVRVATFAAKLCTPRYLYVGRTSVVAGDVAALGCNCCCTLNSNVKGRIERAPLEGRAATGQRELLVDVGTSCAGCD